MKHDPDAKVSYFEATGKIVGTVKEVRMISIKRDIKALDSSILIEKKPIVKSLKEGKVNKVKITKEQYNRIFASKLVNESEVNGGLNRVNTTFKKEFAGKNIQNIKEDDFNINKPNKSIPSLNEANDIKSEVIELIKYLYRKSETLSPFWEKNGLDYDTICDTLLNKKIIISKNGKYELSKSLGSPQAAKQAVEDELKALLPQEHKEEPELAPELETEVNNHDYPAGADADSSAPWNEKDPEFSNPTVAENPELTTIGLNTEIAILKGPDESLYVFYYGNHNKKDFMEYAAVTRKYIGRDEDGGPEYEYDNDFEIDADVITNFVNDNLSILTKGDGLDSYENGDDLVKIDEPLKNELINLYDKDQNVIKSLKPIEEVEFPELMTGFKANMDRETTEKPKIPQNKIVAKLAELKAKEKARQEAEQASIDAASAAATDIEEITGAASSGSFTGAFGGGEVVKRDLPNVPVVGETTTVGSVGGQYDAPALANVGRNGEFKNGPKTKAQKSTQYAGGSFVETSGCSKLNNNKEAKNGKCSQGAVDGVVTQKKSKSSVITPSLDENVIYEMIAKKTGKSIEEIKKIIELNNNKA